METATTVNPLIQFLPLMVVCGILGAVYFSQAKSRKKRIEEIIEEKGLNAADASAGCSLCQKNITSGKEVKLLNEKVVCRKCYFAFANRRQFAFFIDFVLLRISAYAVAALLGIALVALGMHISSANLKPFLDVVGWLLLGAFLFKDGFDGCSPGKALMGIQVLNIKKNVSGGFLDSLKRNFLLFIPLVPVIVAVQLCKGDRWGDGIASTRVIWKKYKNSQPFLFQVADAAKEI